MSRREAWDPVSGTVYTPRGHVHRGRARLVTHEHTCPDGTLVVVSAQYVEMTDTTLYRWEIGGKWADPTSCVGDTRDVPPNWSFVDAAHSVAV